MKMMKKPMLWLLVGVAMVLAALVLVACAPAAVPTEAPVVVVVNTPVPPTEAPTPAPVDQSMYHDALAASGHGSYDLGKGPNDYCSRCHSPQNWNPESQPGPSPNCIVCKFPFDPEVRQVDTMNFVDEADWVGMPCATCHELDSDGVSDGNIAWLNPLTMDYDVVNTPNELCRKCHLSSAGVKFSGGRGAEHEIDLTGTAHSTYAGEFPQSDRPQYCSDCHDPHTQVAMACQDCHVDIAESTTHMKGYNALMLDKVSCTACHNATEMEVGLVDGIFETVVSEVGRSGTLTTTPTYSHNIQWLVACDRCHFEGNEWELTVRDADGEIPSDEPAAGPPGG